MIAAAGYQHIRMYDLVSNNPNPIINYEGVSKNITGLGFQVFYNYILLLISIVYYFLIVKLSSRR